MADLEHFLRSENGTNFVRPARYLTNHWLHITHLFLTSVPCVLPSFGKLEFKIPDLEHFLRSYEFFWKVMCTGSAAQIFNCFKICLLPLFLLFGQTFICGGYYCLSDILVYFVVWQIKWECHHLYCRVLYVQVHMTLLALTTYGLIF